VRATMKPLQTFAALGAIAVLVVSAPGTARADLASSFGVYVYPTKNQDANQQAAAESECYSSAQNKTGFNPSAPPQAPAQAPTSSGGLFRGGARGAGAGAAIGAVAGNAGEGAAIGAIAGGLFGMHRQKMENEQAAQAAQYNANAAYQGGMSNFRTAFSACMNARGYVAR
jgi:hypothetical protein